MKYGLHCCFWWFLLPAVLLGVQEIYALLHIKLLKFRNPKRTRQLALKEDHSQATVTSLDVDCWS